MGILESTNQKQFATRFLSVSFDKEIFGWHLTGQGGKLWGASDPQQVIKCLNIELRESSTEHDIFVDPLVN